MRGRLVARKDLRSADVDAMYRLLDRHFAGVGRAGFEADLADKGWAVLVEGTERLVGFSTFRLDRERVRGEDATVVFSGDTIVEPEAWGSRALPRTWIQSVRSLHEAVGGGPVWWLLLTSGFRTYRFLPVFCRAYHSGPATEGDELGEVAACLARRRFGDRYDAATGIVRLPRPQRLRRPLLEIPPGRREDPHVRRFLELNPGHARGDELVSVAPLDDANLTRAGRRMLDGAA